MCSYARKAAIAALGNSADANYLQMLTPYAEHTTTCESEFALWGTTIRCT